MKKEFMKEYLNRLNELYVGKKIVNVGYKEDMDEFYLELEDGTIVTL